MKAALVQGPNQSPVYADHDVPAIAGDELLVRMEAASISHVTKSRAAGSHYSARGRFPLIPGIDGVGTLEDGRRVYCLMPKPPFGTIAEFAPISPAHLLDFPASVSSVTAAAIAIPGMSSWAALTDRAHFVAGETVLVNGATGTSGQLAVQIAKHLGAAIVIATGRNAESLALLEELGADVTVQLGDDLDAFESSLERLFSARIDVVLDYLWGGSARAAVIAAAKGSPDGVPIRFVHIGAASSPSMDLPSAALRSSSIELMGSGIGSIPLDRLRDAIRSVLEAAGQVRFKIETKTFPLSDVSAAWTDAGRARAVVTIP